MSEFTGPLRVTFLEHTPGEKDSIRLDQPLVWRIGHVDSTEAVVVPKGFESDGASIPRLAWPFVGHPLGRMRKAGVLHDFCVRTAVGRRALPGQSAVTEFFRACRACGVNRFSASAAWLVLTVWTPLRGPKGVLRSL